MNKTRWTLSMLLLALWFAAPAALRAQQPEHLTLKQALDRAMKNSQDVALAQLRYNVAQNTARMDASAFSPNLYTGSGAAYTYGFPQTPGGAAPSIINFTYAQTLINTSLRGQVQAARERAEEQKLELQKTRNSVAVQTSSAYLELAKVRHSMELMRNQRRSSSRILDFTRERVREGVELPIEITRAELDQARLEQRIVTLETRETALQRDLAALLGLPKDSRVELDPAALSLDEDVAENDLVHRALGANFDVREAEYERRARQHRVAGEQGMRWPTVDLFMEYGYFAKFNNFQDYFRTFQRNNVNVGVQVRIPILNGQRPANVALARSELTVSEAELENKRQSLELEIGRQYQHLRELDAAREVARLELKLAQENVQVLQARFDEGKANLRDVERARLDENDKWVAFLDAGYNRQKAQLDLLNITGDLGPLFR